MKNLPLILSSVALLGVLFLFGKNMSSSKAAKTTVVKTDSSGKKVEVQLSRIAYVNLDTLESKYTSFVNKKKQFEAREKRINTELESLAKALEKDLLNTQKKAQSGTLTEAEYKSAEKRLGNKQKTIEQKRNNLGKALLKDRDDFNKSYMDKLKKTINDFNNDGAYDYVMLYVENGTFLYANDALDITTEILNRLNSSK